MVTPELIAYIQQELSFGVSPQELKSKLLVSGWPERDVFDGMEAASRPGAKQYLSSAPSLKNIVANEFSVLLDASWREYRLNLKKILLMQGVQLGLIILSTMSVLPVTLFSKTTISSPLCDSADCFFAPGGSYLISLAIYFIFGLISAIFSNWLPSLALINAINGQFFSGVGDFYRKAWKGLGKLISLKVETGVFIFLASLLFLGTVMIVALLAAWLSNVLSPMVHLFTVFFAVAGVVGLIAVYSWLIFAPYILVAENTGATESLKRSRYYIKGREMKIILHSLAVGFIFLVFLLIPVIGYLIDVFLVTPLTTIYFYKLYLNFRHLKNPEGGDAIYAK